MKLILIRHGESAHGLHQYIADVGGCRGLTAHGIHQAERLATRFQTTGEVNDCTMLLSSPVPRARQTTHTLHSVLPHVSVQETADLCEIRPGVADGLTWDTYRTTYGAFDLVAEPHRPFAPQGESWSQFTARVQRTLEQLARQYQNQTVIAVSHAGFIVVAFLSLFAIPRPGTRTRLDPRYTSLTIWTMDTQGWRLERYNDARHLDGPNM